jgi:formyltetrahydrofolate-dependent phosphoribosylglycinamide formyltransferase
MFKRLQQKWKVGPLQIVLILVCFATGGSLTGYSAKKIMNLLPVEQDWLWGVIYIILLSVIWPLAVIITSIFFGQFRFFSGYVRRLGEKLGLVGRRGGVESSESGVQSPGTAVQSWKADHVTIHHSALARIAIFASGAGSNALRIIEHFRHSTVAQVACIFCNKPGAGVLKIAAENNIPAIILEKEKFFRGNGYLDDLKERKINFIVLAGFLWKIPEPVLKVYPRRIINIHPALLPNYGGKGMYGNHVHEAVISAKEKESGITIHYVDEHYDNGDIILQVRCPVLENDNAQSLAHRIHALEHANYPVIIEELISKSGK